jgi:hypothetical protein
VVTSHCYLLADRGKARFSTQGVYRHAESGSHSGPLAAGPTRTADQNACRHQCRFGGSLGYPLDEWLTGHQVGETTCATYRLLIDGFIRQVFGDTPISDPSSSSRLV